MKVLEKILIIILIALSLCVFPKENFAEEYYVENSTRTNKVKNEMTEEEIKEEGKRLAEEEKNRKIPKGKFKLLTREQEEKIAEIIDIKQEDKIFIIIITIIILILMIFTMKTEYVHGSTKPLILILLLAVFSIVLRYMVKGKIVNFLDIFIPILGVILIAISYYYIYKNNNLLIYIPICAAGTYYCINNIEFIIDNITYKIILIILPIILFVAGKMIEKIADEARIKPIKEKSERNNNEKQ